MNRKIGRMLMVSVLVLGFLAPVLDARVREVLLGSRLVDFQVDHDEIVVGSYQGSFRKLRFHVAKNDVEIFDLVLVYANGERDNVPVKLIFNEQERSRIIDLEGRRRKLQRIIFNYRSLGSWVEGNAEVRAEVTVFGIR